MRFPSSCKPSTRGFASTFGTVSVLTMKYRGCDVSRSRPLRNGPAKSIDQQYASGWPTRLRGRSLPVAFETHWTIPPIRQVICSAGPVPQVQVLALLRRQCLDLRLVQTGALRNDRSRDSLHQPWGPMPPTWPTIPVSPEALPATELPRLQMSSHPGT